VTLAKLDAAVAVARRRAAKHPLSEEAQEYRDYDLWIAEMTRAVAESLLEAPESKRGGGEG
jgi:hypothetical protein